MTPLTDPQIRASFVNVTKGAAKRMHVPRDLDARRWDELDYLGWSDPQAPGRGQLVAEVDGVVRGVALRIPPTTAGHVRRSLCSLCLTQHTGGVSLMVAPRAGKAGQQGHSVGTYICTDLACSLYVRRKRETGAPRMHETLTEEQRIERLVENLRTFMLRVLD